MCQTEFRVVQISNGYGVELLRNGEPYVMFLQGVTRQAAERSARDLTALWRRISASQVSICLTHPVERSPVSREG